MKNRTFYPINHIPIHSVHSVETIDDLIPILTPEVSKALTLILFFTIPFFYGIVGEIIISKNIDSSQNKMLQN